MGRGEGDFWKWVQRVRMLGRAVVVMSRKMCCMSTTRRIVAGMMAVIYKYKYKAGDVEGKEMGEQ